MHLENYPSLRRPTVFTDEPIKQARLDRLRLRPPDAVKSAASICAHTLAHP
jgi:hypothetical protein